MRAAVYCRISRRTRTSDETIAEQRKRGLAVIAARGWTLVRDDDEDTFTDDGSSAYRDDVRREAFERLVARCQAREVDLIVCRDVDRLSRRDRDTHTAILKMRGGTTMREATTWMLNGLAFCGRCRNRLVGNNSGDRRRYHCAPYIGKTHRETGERVDCRLAVDARAAEREVWDRAIARAWQVDDDDQERSEQIVVDARAALVAAERRMDKIDEQYVAGHLTDDRWIKLGHQIQSEVAAARVALDQAEHQRLAHPARWRLPALSELDDLEVTDARRRAEIHAVVRRVMIKPARRSGPFDAARVEVDWR